MLAGILDFFVLIPPFWLLLAWIAVSHGVYQNGSYSLNGGPALLLDVIILVIWISYHIVCEVFFGGTLGMRVASVEVRSTNSTSIRFIQVLARNLLRPIDAVGFYLLGGIVALFSKRNQTIGDRVARTIVYEKEGSRRRRAVLLWLVLIAGEWTLIFVYNHFAFPLHH